MNHITDKQGHHWPITGHYCQTCGMPMHPTNQPYGTHPTCERKDQ